MGPTVARRATVPKAAINEYGEQLFRKHKIRLAGQIIGVHTPPFYP
jgi:hypothetical protein